MDKKLLVSYPDRQRTAVRAAEGWQKRYARSLVVIDCIVVIVVFGVSQFVQFGFTSTNVAPSGERESTQFNYVSVSVIVALLWALLLSLYGTRDSRVVASGIAEYKAVFQAGVALFAVVAIIAVVVKVDLARGYLVTIAIGTLLVIVCRWSCRKWLGAQRRRGRMSSAVILVGSADSVRHVAEQLARAPEAGYVVIGACVPQQSGTSLAGTDITLLGRPEEVFDTLEQNGADTVIVTSSDVLMPEQVRELSWLLEPGRHHLVMAPNLTDVSGPRLHTRPVAGLPLVHVETPRLSSGSRFAKRAFDFIGALVLVMLLSPVFLLLMLLVAVSSRGPIFYQQERIGFNSVPFRMHKFRSMRVGADAELAALLREQGSADTPLFKVKNDPRITPVGRVLRKYSLDELPQLFNVIGGTMSLVGPRPQREPEVALYDSSARRRLLVKPGMSGLWQVSGRSNLSWEDAIRLDLYYVENWSFFGDIGILMKTFRQVILPDGAV